MNTINTLTVNGQSYALPDPRSVLDDSAAGPETTWSGQKLAAMDASASIVCQAEGKAIAVSDASDRAPVGLKVYGKTSQNGTPAPDAPVALVSVGESGAITATVHSGNLCDPHGFSQTKYYTVDENGYINFTNNTPYENYPSIQIKLPKGTYTVTVDIQENENSITDIYVNKKAGDYNYLTKTSVVRTYTDADLIWIMFAGRNGTKCKARFMVNAGSAALPWQPYKGQTLTVSTPNGLPGIPVSDGGNYTDETGQAWICDEIDLARGVYVRRLGVIESYAGEAVSGAYMSTTGELSEGASVLYALEGPDETALSAAELAAYAALHTVKPNTTVYNDASAHMALCYVADTKLYIDRKLAALSGEVTA